MERIGKYRVLGPLGRGGMGQVYLAEDPDIGRRVAIKVLLPESDDDARRRFTQEARTMGRLSHPHVVMLLEYGFHGELPYLVLEYLEGTSLDRWLATDPPLDARLQSLRQLAQAVDYAHRNEVLHRDIKPANIQILADGQLKLLDFGIAKNRAQKLTATGILVGTPEYMAPEVLRDGDHSRRSDVYAVGLVAYEALSGEHPFRAKQLEACLHKVLTLTPTPLAEQVDVPEPLSDAVMACLQKDPAARPESLAWLDAELERARGGLVSPTRPTLRLATDADSDPSSEAPTRRADDAAGRLPRHRAGLWILAGIVATVVALAGTLYWTTDSGTLGPDAGSGTTEAVLETAKGESAPDTTVQADTISWKGSDLPEALSARDTASPNEALESETSAVKSPAEPAPKKPRTPSQTQPPQVADDEVRSPSDPAVGRSEPAPRRTLELLSDSVAQEHARTARPDSPPNERDVQQDEEPRDLGPGSVTPQLSYVVPARVRRGDSATLRLRGRGLEAVSNARVRRAGQVVPGIHVVRIAHDGALLEVHLQVGREVGLGAYTLHVGAPGSEGELIWSEGLSLEVGL